MKKLVFIFSFLVSHFAQAQAVAPMNRNSNIGTLCSACALNSGGSTFVLTSPNQDPYDVAVFYISSTYNSATALQLSCEARYPDGSGTRYNVTTCELNNGLCTASVSSYLFTLPASGGSPVTYNIATRINMIGLDGMYCTLVGVGAGAGEVATVKAVLVKS